MMGIRWGVVAVVLGTAAFVGLACSGDGPPSILISPVGSGNVGDASSSSGGGSSSSSGAADASQETTATPRFNPPSGTSFFGANLVMITSATPNSTIYFTTDETDPTTSSSVYTGPLSILVRTTTIRAFAVASGLRPSNIAAATFIPWASPWALAFTPSAGQFENAVAITLSTGQQPSTICYTVNGLNPTCSQGSCTGVSATFSAAIPVVVDASPGGAVTLKALGCYAENDHSDVTTAVYTFKVAAVSIVGAGTNTVSPYDPTSSPTWSTGVADETFTFQTATQSETIRYAWGTAPAAITCAQPCSGTLASPDAACTSCTDSDVASGGCVLDVPPSTTINAVGCKAGYASSPLRTLVYAAP